MRLPFDCAGDMFAHMAGIEAPTCWCCDRPILDLKKLQETTRGDPLCPACASDIDDRYQAKRLIASVAFSEGEAS